MFILIIVMISLAAHGDTMDDRALMLLHAKDPKGLKIKINEMNNLKKTETACEFELSMSMIPKSCYRLKLSNEKRQIVEEACERASLKMKEPAQTSGLSKPCTEFVNKKNKDIRYSQSEVDPGEFLR